MKLVKSFNITEKTINEKDYTVEAIVSDSTIDRDGEIILTSAFAEDLHVFEKNPVLCWGHPLSAMCDSPGPENVLGSAVAMEIRDAGLWCKFKYAVEENPNAALCFRLIKSGHLKAYSIGAMGIKFVDRNSPAEEKALIPPHAREALDSGACTRVWTRMALVEISNCFVGSNKSALVTAAMEGDPAALEMLAKANDVAGMDLVHRAAVLLRKISADQSHMAAQLADIRKRLDEPVEIEVLGPPPAEPPPVATKADEPNPNDEVVQLVAAAVPVLLAVAQSILD